MRIHLPWHWARGLMTRSKAVRNGSSMQRYGLGLPRHYSKLPIQIKINSQLMLTRGLGKNGIECGALLQSASRALFNSLSANQKVFVWNNKALVLRTLMRHISSTVRICDQPSKIFVTRAVLRLHAHRFEQCDEQGTWVSKETTMRQ